MIHTLYQRSATGNVMVWRIWKNNENIVFREWGVLGGAIQQTMEPPSTRGVEGHGSFKDAAQVADELIARLIKGKKDEGYVENQNYVPLSITAGELSFAHGLPIGFSPAKPVSSIEDEKLRLWDSKGLIMFQRKRDGQRHFVYVDVDGDVKIYSRNLEDRTLLFPKMVQHFRDMGLPRCTILDGEIVIDRAGIDDFRALGSITNSLPTRAARYEESMPVIFMVFDVLYYGGFATWKEVYLKRYTLITGIEQSKTYRHPTVVLLTFDKATALARDQKWEGLVCWRKDQASVLQMNGKPKRCNAYKWKPVQNGDFIATGFEWGNGRHSAVAGALKLAESVNGKLKAIGSVGTGLDDATRAEILKWKFPCVVEVNYDLQQPDTRALRFPVFVRRRDDKKVSECASEQSENPRLF